MLDVLLRLADELVQRLEFLLGGFVVRYQPLFAVPEQTPELLEEAVYTVNSLGIPGFSLLDGAQEHLVQTQGVCPIRIANLVRIHHIVHALGHLFNGIVGVMNDEREEIVDVDLYFNYGTKDKEANKEVRLFFNLLKSNPFYEGFRFEENKDNGFARAKIRPNHELGNHLMMFAHTAYISNETVRKSIIQRAHQILATQHADRQPQ